MNSLTNALLFVASILLLALCFVAVSVVAKKMSLSELGEMVSPNNIVARFQDGTNKSVDSTQSGAILANQVRDSKGDFTTKSWSNIFAKKDLPSYRYPAPALFIALDFSGKNRTDILKISNLDSYKFFCLKEILKSNNIQFAYTILGKNAEVRIALDSTQKRVNLISELKRYNIAYHIIKG